MARRLVQTRPLSELIVKELFPGSDVTKNSDLKAAVLAEINTYNHPVGTCRMGPTTDSTSVVDTHGKVHGVEVLYVIDASIMPVIPSANTNLPAIMIAERCADWLK